MRSKDIRFMADNKLHTELSGNILLQWHITNRCNLRCYHCYQDNFSGKEMSFDEFMGIVEQFQDLIELKRKKTEDHKVKGHITITGGEPFIRNDLWDLLEVLNEKNLGFALLTNGSYIDEEIAKVLKRLNPRFVQVSLEGTQKTHDSIRGKGSYDKTISAVKYLVKKKVRTMISFTAHKINFKEFTDVARIGRKLKVSKVWADRLIPGKNNSEMSLSTLNTREFIKIMNKARAESMKLGSFRTEISMHRALQFLEGGGRPYACTAGDSLITLMPNGDLYPCRRMPIKVGNILKTPLKKLYYENELLRKLRNKKRVSVGCQGCFYSGLCRGGLKCLSLAVTKDPFTADPGCWIAVDNIENECKISDRIASDIL